MGLAQTQRMLAERVRKVFGNVQEKAGSTMEEL